MGTLLAEEAIRLVGRHLVRAVHQADDREARDGMALAATLAGLAFSNCGVALVHALTSRVSKSSPTKSFRARRGIPREPSRDKSRLSFRQGSE